MRSTNEPDCVLGFIFNTNQTQVLLVHKRRPAWQQGKVNGVGGKLEVGETPLQAMVRETQEETGLQTKPEDWCEVGCMWDAASITVFAYVHPGREEAAYANDHEAIAWYAIDELPKNVIPNLHWLVPLAQYKLAGEYKTFSMHYN